jgi:hypothetical protein
MGIFQTPGSNAQDIINDIKAYLKPPKATQKDSLYRKL